MSTNLFFVTCTERFPGFIFSFDQHVRFLKTCMYFLPWPKKALFIAQAIAPFSWWCGMPVYSVEKSNVLTFLTDLLLHLSISDNTDVELSMIQNLLNPEKFSIALQYRRCCCCTSFKHLVMMLDKSFEAHHLDAAKNRCLLGFLCIFGDQYMKGRCFRVSSTSMPHALHLATCCWTISSSEMSTRLYVGFFCVLAVVSNAQLLKNDLFVKHLTDYSYVVGSLVYRDKHVLSVQQLQCLLNWALVQ